MTTSRLRAVLGAAVLGSGIAGCASVPKGESIVGKDSPKTHEVRRLAQALTVAANWDAPAWQGVAPLELTYFMGDRPAHFPKVQAKLAYDDAALYVIFRVEDRYVRAVAKKHQDPVCRDSCAEFFFAPGDDVAPGYFNIETNCGGTMLFHFQVVPRQNQVPLTPEELARVQIAHTMPKIVDPEVAAPTTWCIEYRVPFDILGRYYPAAKKPAPGVLWKANFFKCGDDTSHPHWLTWSYVDRPRPDFHVPTSFGTLMFR